MCINVLFGRLNRTKRQQLLGPLADSKMRLFLCTPRYFVAFDHIFGLDELGCIFWALCSPLFHL